MGISICDGNESDLGISAPGSHPNLHCTLHAFSLGPLRCQKEPKFFAEAVQARQDGLGLHRPTPGGGYSIATTSP